MEFLENHQYRIDYDIDGSYNCEENGCNDEGICRCYTIHNVEIKSVDIAAIAESIYQSIFDEKSTQFKRDNKINKLLFGIDRNIDVYCIDRILRSNKLYDPESWEANWGSDYYGEEVNNININRGISKKLSEQFDELFTLNTLKEKIDYVLIKEYGYILDKIKDKEYEVKVINTEDITFPQEEYKKKIDSTDYYSDNRYNLIRGVCYFDGEKYKVIDGYHRLTSTKNKTTKIINIYGN